MFPMLFQRNHEFIAPFCIFSVSLFIMYVSNESKAMKSNESKAVKSKNIDEWIRSSLRNVTQYVFVKSNLIPQRPIIDTKVNRI